MPVPNFQSLMLPVLKSLADTEGKHTKEIRMFVKELLNLTDDDEQESYPSGVRIFADRVSWALTYIQRAGLINRVSRGVYELTQDGKDLLKTKPESVNRKTLRGYKAFQEWTAKVEQQSKPASITHTESDQLDEIPLKVLEQTIQRIRGELEADLLTRTLKGSPGFFERIVHDLLIAMGYGGGDSEMGEVIGGPGDKGIDVTINEDRLGLDRVHIQAKKYGKDHNVGAGEVRNFAGAIDASGTNKGVFITTSKFTQAAMEFVKQSTKRIVLVDGDELVRLMVDYGVGVHTQTTHDLKQLDELYFDQDTE